MYIDARNSIFRVSFFAILVLLIVAILSGCYSSESSSKVHELESRIEQLEYEIEAEFDRGRSIGYDDGFSDGEDAGYAEGFENGYEAGFMDGAEAGYADGYADCEAGY